MHDPLTSTPFATFLQHNLRLGQGRDFRLAAWMLLALAAGFLAYVARVHEITHDVFHEMSLYRESLVLGEFPQDDVFAYTPTVSPSVHHEWATGAVLYFVTIGTGLGLAGLAGLKFLLIAALWLMLYRVARMRGAHPYIFALFAFFCFPVFWVGFATIRAQLFTLVFVAAQLWMQELDWRGRRAWTLLWLVMLMAWLNMHAGFVVGLGLISFHSMERCIASWFAHRSLSRVFCDTWHLIATAPVALAALLVNPYGAQYIPYLVRAIAMDRPLIREWLPLWHTHDPVVTLTMFGASLAIFVFALRNNPLRRWRGASFLVLSAYMTLKHIRHGSIFGVVWLAYVPAWISRTSLGKNFILWIDQCRVAMIRTSQVLTCVCLLFAGYHHCWRPTLPPVPRYSSASYPTQALSYLQDQGFRGNLMTPFHVGAYVSWEMYPDVKVSFDGRYEVAYQDHIMSEHDQFYDGDEHGWSLLDKYPTDAVLIHQQAKVCDQLEAFRGRSRDSLPKTNEDWRIVYEDDAFILLAAAHCQLPAVDRRNEPLRDRAWDAFTSNHAHWNRRWPTKLANAVSGAPEKESTSEELANSAYGR